MMELKSPPFHRELSDIYMDKSVQRVNIIAPRGHAKTSIVAGLFVIHHFLECTLEKKPFLIVLVSKTQGHALNLLDWVKTALDFNPHLRACFGYHGQHVSKRWKHDFIQTTYGAVVARGTGQMVVGLKIGNTRPTLVILDDPEDMENTKTETALEYNLKWLLQQLEPTLDAHRGRIWVIGTPQHQRCMVYMLKKSSGWTSRHYSAEVDSTTHEVLWPEQWSWERLQEKRASLESMRRLSSYYREYLCQVIADEEQLFREEMLKYWDGECLVRNLGDNTLIIRNLNGKVLDEPEYRSVNVFIGVDPAFSVAQSADYTVIMPLAIDKDWNIFQLPYTRGHFAPTDTIAHILKTHKLWQSRKVSIETTAAQDTIREILSRLEGEYIPGIWQKHTSREKKEKNYIAVLEPYFVKGKFHLMINQSDALKNELLMFGPTTEHDDTIDATYLALSGAYPATHMPEIPGKKKQGKIGEGMAIATKNSWQYA